LVLNYSEFLSAAINL
jgi:calcium-dependent protein kinase